MSVHPWSYSPPFVIRDIYYSAHPIVLDLTSPQELPLEWEILIPQDVQYIKPLSLEKSEIKTLPTSKNTTTSVALAALQMAPLPSPIVAAQPIESTNKSMLDNDVQPMEIE